MLLFKLAALLATAYTASATTQAAPSGVYKGFNGTSHPSGNSTYTGAITPHNVAKVVPANPSGTKIYFYDTHGKKQYLEHLGGKVNLTASDLIPYFEKHFNTVDSSTNSTQKFRNDTATKGAHSKRYDVPYCNNYYTDEFDQDSWGFWWQPWRQVGACYYCNTCSLGISVSAAVTFQYTVTIGADVGGLISATFGYSWGETTSLSQTFTCNWNPQNSNGCNTIWFQPEMSWHKGWGKRKKWGYCNPGTTWFISEQDAYYNNVDQPIKDANGKSFGNWGCGSGCQDKSCGASTHGNECCFANAGGTLGWI